MLFGWKENSMLTNCLAACAHLSITVSEIQRDIGRKSRFFSYPLHSTPPLGGFPLEYCHAVWCGKTRMAWLPEGEKILKIRLLVLAQLTNVTDRRTDAQTNVMFRRQNALSGNFTIPFITFSSRHREEMTAVRCI